jgi:hypothetical protein
MKDSAKISEVNYKGTLFSFFLFMLANGCVFAFFAVLWVLQYHLDGNVSDWIDLIVVPYGWLAGFFIASFVTVRRSSPKFIAVLISVGSAVVLSGILFLVKIFLLVPFFDPMF